MFGNFIVYFLCLYFLYCFYYFVGDWKLKGQLEWFSGGKGQNSAISKSTGNNLVLQRWLPKVAALSCCLQIIQKLSTAVLVVWHRDAGTLVTGLDLAVPDLALGNDAYKSLLSPKFDVDCLRTLRIQTLTLLEQFGSNLRRK